jgi:hypothetical protein
MPTKPGWRLRRTLLRRKRLGPGILGLGKRGNPSPHAATVLVESEKGDSVPLRTAVVAAGFQGRSWQEEIGESIATLPAFGKTIFAKSLLSTVVDLLFC